jgi:hypothetical protein
MKRKILLTLAFAIAIFIKTFAQEGINFQLFGQAHSKMISGDYFREDFSTKDVAMEKKFSIGYQGGISGGYGFNDNMGVSLGLLYSAQGQNYSDFEEEVNNDGHTFKRKVALNYLTIPVHFTFTADPSAMLSFSAFAGFYFSSLLSYNDEITLQYSESQASTFDGTATVSADDYKWEYTDHGAHSNQTFNLKSQPYKSSDFGISAGAGVDLQLVDNVYLPLMLTYQLGLADIKNNSSTVEHDGITESYWEKFSKRNGSEKLSNSTLGLRIALKIVLE